MTDEQIKKFLFDECETVDNSMTLERYIDTICQYLMLCSWKYSKQEASKIVSQYTERIKKGYKAKETIGDVATDIGFAGG